MNKFVVPLYAVGLVKLLVVSAGNIAKPAEKNYGTSRFLLFKP
jgi:hypothetical protein